MNPFGEELRQKWPIGEGALFSIKANLNNIGPTMIAWVAEPYDFSVVNTFTMYYTYDPTLRNFTPVAINMAGSTPAATLASEVATALNANTTFSNAFVASVANNTRGGVNAGPPYTVVITTNRPKGSIRYYVDNSGAESKLLFNLKAPVAELPTYFSRDTVTNRYVYPDSDACLIELNPGNPIDAQIITNAGFDPLTVQADWQLLHGRSVNDSFSKITLDGSGRITTIIEYWAGSVAGDLGKKTQFTYTSTNTTADQITQIPVTLQSGDLVTPP